MSPKDKKQKQADQSLNLVQGPELNSYIFNISEYYLLDWI